MADIEKIIETMQKALDNSEIDGTIYAEIRRPVVFDVIQLLKEREPKAVDEHGRMFTIRYGSCPNCLKQIDSEVNPKACGYCGQVVKWVGEM